MQCTCSLAARVYYVLLPALIAILVEALKRLQYHINLVPFQLLKRGAYEMKHSRAKPSAHCTSCCKPSRQEHSEVAAASAAIAQCCARSS